MSTNKLTVDDKVEACKEYFKTHHSVPPDAESYTYKNVEFKIGVFIRNVRSKNSYPTNVKHEIETLTHKSSVFKPRKMCSQSKCQEAKLELIKNYFNEFKRMPRKYELYNDTNIENVINSVIRTETTYNKLIRNEVIEMVNEIKKNEGHVILDIIKEYIKEHNALPKQREEYKGISISKVIHGVLTSGLYPEIKTELENIVESLL